MSRVFAIADLHFGHRNVALWRGFPDVESHDSAIVAAWNRVVTKRDVVYVLGDVCGLAHLPLLRGTKKLCLGNHDTKPVGHYLLNFSKVAAYFDFDNCLLSHMPVHPNQSKRWKLNVHGHVHANYLDNPWYVNVSVEACTRLEPYPLRELIQARLLTV